MQTISSWKNGIISGLFFFVTVILLSTVYAAVSSLSVTDKVVSGSGLTAASWNKLVDNILDLNTKTTDITSLNGNIGIGATNPATKLEVNGIITAANVNQDPILSTQPATRPTISFAAGSWRYTGESITVTVPSGPSRKYRVVNRQVIQYGFGTQ